MSKTADNLEILADHIEANVSQEQIDMEHVARSGNCKHLELKDVQHYLETDCGTTACALGHAAMAFPDVAARSACWGEFEFALFPELTLENDYFHLEINCFGATKSSKKEDVIKRLKEAAAELRAGS